MADATLEPVPVHRRSIFRRPTSTEGFWGWIKHGEAQDFCLLVLLSHGEVGPQLVFSVGCSEEGPTSDGV